MKIKRFLLFAGEKYYPRGGYGDYIGSFDSIEDADKELQEISLHEAGELSDIEWAHLWDIEEDVVIFPQEGSGK
jgi:hypothetical protein